jgi:hypothetical protein
MYGVSVQNFVATASNAAPYAAGMIVLKSSAKKFQFPG